jgi:hypothetical protein
VYELRVIPRASSPTSVADLRNAATSALRALVVYTLVLASAEEEGSGDDLDRNPCEMIECYGKTRVIETRVVYMENEQDGDGAKDLLMGDACSVRALRPVPLGNFQTASCALECRVYIPRDDDDSTI